MATATVAISMAQAFLEVSIAMETAIFGALAMTVACCLMPLCKDRDGFLNELSVFSIDSSA